MLSSQFVVSRTHPLLEVVICHGTLLIHQPQRQFSLLLSLLLLRLDSCERSFCGCLTCRRLAYGLEQSLNPAHHNHIILIGDNGMNALCSQGHG